MRRLSYVCLDSAALAALRHHLLTAHSAGCLQRSHGHALKQLLPKATPLWRSHLPTGVQNLKAV